MKDRIKVFFHTPGCIEQNFWRTVVGTGRFERVEIEGEADIVVVIEVSKLNGFEYLHDNTRPVLVATYPEEIVPKDLPKRIVFQDVMAFIVRGPELLEAVMTAREQVTT